MIRFILTIVASCLFATLTAASSLKVEEHASPQGQAYSLVRMPDTAQTRIHFVWKGANGFLDREKQNVAELGPYLVLHGGAADLPPDELGARLNALGAGLQLYSSAGGLQGTLDAPPANLVEAGELFAVALAEPALDARWLRRFQRSYVENVTRDASTPAGQGWRSLRSIVMDEHPLLQFWNDTPVENISGITVDDIRDWHRRAVTRHEVEIFVAGSADPAIVGKAIDAVLSALPLGAARQELPKLGMSYPGKIILVHRPEDEKSYVLIAGPVPPLHSADQQARELGIGVLGVSDQSRLHTAIRKELRASYDFGAWSASFTADHAMLYLQGEVATDRLETALTTIGEAYESLRTGGIGPLEFPFARRIYKNRATDIARSPAGVTGLMAEAWLGGANAQFGAAYPDRAAALARGSVNQVIAKDFPPFSHMVKVIVSPDRNAVSADCVINDFSEAQQCR